MASISPDVSSRLKPEVIQVVKIIYEELCNLQPDQNVLIISDARTPDYIVATFQGRRLRISSVAYVRNP